MAKMTQHENPQYYKSPEYYENPQYYKSPEYYENPKYYENPFDLLQKKFIDNFEILQ